ncbi:glycine dehydrogenase (aminomethyl-transferring) [Alkalilimnicola ehrlichii]|uniref:Probable glycine dehydrogenase (decarboxylating) subunit 1 n=1 Tax=Alkalilimnicola ehrlichii TaxID=351052 RepID=A0A3E0X1H6_9GAMM|nr:aminomethyl-transferring glycine dehydrogenase subunit GcvPA [Alkalilimnicola ehrlichii]RFA31263.1 glycine dehydrogenase (aminomethyl-transferring) [Alkalilimnicola ehrlichii]RFA39461.1 glycine dehydrogenase (aminomethyl-transferring) [Alkalilimnicola ehrlichii]
MPFIPHTEQDIREMLAAIGADSVDALFDEIPASLQSRPLEGVPAGLTEMEVARLMQARAASDGQPLCFLGAGAYEHHIPAAVWEITTRGEFYSAYTPYQAEASQGTLQVVYEYQTMLASLTGLDVANASLYDGASALAEAVLMAVRANRRTASRRILVPRSIHPLYRRTVDSIVRHQGIELVEVGYVPESGRVDRAALEAAAEVGFAALVIPQPNVFGVLEEAGELCDWAHEKGALAIGLVNPTALALLQPPGEWGEAGADIACGEGQPLGVPLAAGGPYFGFMSCRQSHVRQMPGRIVGATLDSEGRRGFTLTLQPREQHIRRSKATSNICTNQGLMVTAATMYLALLGPQGLERVAAACHANTRALRDALAAVGDDIDVVFQSPFFHELVVRLPQPVAPVLDALADKGILGGWDIGEHYPELGNALLVCATETRTADDIRAYADALREVLQ